MPPICWWYSALYGTQPIWRDIQRRCFISDRGLCGRHTDMGEWWFLEFKWRLYSVRKIRKYLDGPIAEKIINATVASRLDYCNSLLLYGAKNRTYTDCSVARIMQPGLYLKGASLTILALCWENYIGFPWSLGSVTKFCSSPTRHWMAMLHNILQH